MSSEPQFAAVANFAVHTGIVRALPTIALTTAETTSLELGTLPASARMLEGLARHMRMRRLTPAQLAVAASRPVIDIVLASRSVTLEVDGTSYLRLDLARTAVEEWVRKGFGDVRVVFAARNGTAPSLGGMVRKIAKAQSGYFASARIWDFRAPDPRLDLYTFLSGSTVLDRIELAPQERVSTYVDTNVLINLQKALESDQDAGGFETVRDVAVSLRGLDPIPGFAIGEMATVNSRPEFATAQARAAIETFRDLKLSELDPDSARAFYVRRRREHEASPGEAVETGQEALIRLNYLSLLQLAKVWIPLDGKPFRASQRIEALQSYLSGVNRAGIGVSAYPMALCAMLLVGNGEESGKIRRMLIPGGRLEINALLASCRNSSWDLLFASLVDHAASGSNERVVADHVLLLTCDKRLVHMRSAVSLVGAIVDTRAPLGIVSIGSSVNRHFSAKQLDELRKIQREMWRVSQMRLLRGEGYEESTMEQALRDVESQVRDLVALEAAGSVDGCGA